MVFISELIGEFGRYQLGLCSLVFISQFGVAFHQMAIIFLAPPAHYRCPANATCCDEPDYDRTVFSRTIVMEWHLICERSWLKDFTQTLFQFGVLSGSLMCGIASDKIGRKPTLIASVILEIFSGLMTSFLPDYWSFTIVRMILGFAVGGEMVVGFVIVMEYVGNNYRDTASALYHAPFTAGHILLALIGYFVRDYVYFQLGISVLNVVLLSYICLLPESPRWLLAANKTNEGVELLQRVARVLVSQGYFVTCAFVIFTVTYLFFFFSNKLPEDDIRTKIELYQIEHALNRQRRGSTLDLFRKQNLRKNMIIMSFDWLVFSYCFYGLAHYISHLTGDVYINVLATGSVCFCACFISIPLMKLMGRKMLIILSSFGSGVCVLAIPLLPEGMLSITMGCFGILFSYTSFIVAYLYCSEMFPTVVRNAALGLASMMARIGSMIAPFVAGLRPYGKWYAPLAFGICPFVAALLCLYLPETKNKELTMTLEEGESLGKKVPRTQTTPTADGVT